jgi:hypothetical protein
MRIGVAATPEVAIPTLDWLISSEHQIVVVITQPDKPAGRGRAIKQSVVGEWASARDIPVVKPISSDDLIGCIDDCNNENNKNIVENFVLNLCNLFYLSFQCELIYTVAKTQTRFKESDANPTFSGDYTEQAYKLTRCIYYKYVLQSSKFDYSESGRITIRTTIIQDYAGSIPIKVHIGDCDLEGTNLFSVKSVIAFARRSDKKDSFKTCFKKILTKISYSVDDANKIFLLFAATHKGSGDFNQVGENVI